MYRQHRHRALVVISIIFTTTTKCIIQASHCSLTQQQILTLQLVLPLSDKTLYVIVSDEFIGVIN